MKVIGIIADTHVPSRSQRIPYEVTKALKNVNLIIHAGDLEEESVLESLEHIAPTVAVLGNHDRKGNLEDKLPASRELMVEGYRLGIVHGDSKATSGRTIIDRVRDNFYPNLPDLIIYGHTHDPVVFSDGQCILINPGSATVARRFNHCSYALVYLGRVIDINLCFFIPGSFQQPLVCRYTFHQWVRQLERKRWDTRI